MNANVERLRKAQREVLFIERMTFDAELQEPLRRAIWAIGDAISIIERRDHEALRKAYGQARGDAY